MVLAGAGRPGRSHLRHMDLVNRIELCGGVLAQHFPPGASNPNEIADGLVEI